MELKNLSKPIQLFFKWRSESLLKNETEILNSIVESSYNEEHIKALLNLIGGNNYSLFKKFCQTESNSEMPDDTNFIDNSKLNVALNAEQVKATLHDISQKPLLILAGAGSGKTAVLTRKIVYMLLNNIPHSSIMAVTFTNKAADEMKHRIISILKQLLEDAENDEYSDFLNNLILKAPEMKTGTFHSICLDLFLGKYQNDYLYELAGFLRKPEIIDPPKQKAIINNICEKNKIPEKPDDIQNDISKCKNELVFPETVSKVKVDIDCSKKSLVKVYSEYRDYLYANNKIDFDDIIFYVVYILQKYPEICAHFTGQYRYFLIDEYQDTNFAQYVFAYKLAEKHKSIFVVGDDDQSIYAWRGADITNIIFFKKDFPQSEIIKFEKNYRSSPIILEAANNIFSDKDKNLRKNLKFSGHHDLHKELNDKIFLYKAKTDNEESEFCSSYIEKKVSKYRNELIPLITNKFKEIYQNIIHISSELLEKYNSLTEYTESFWNRTAGFINQLNVIANDPENCAEIVKLIEIFKNFHSEFSDNEKTYDMEQKILNIFFKKIYPYFENLIRSTMLYRKFAIFFRINSQKEIFKKALSMKNIPFIEVGDNKLFQFFEIQNIISFFKLLSSYLKQMLKGENQYETVNLTVLEFIELPAFKISQNDSEILENFGKSIFLFDPEYISKNSNILSGNAIHFLNSISHFLNRILANPDDILFAFNEIKKFFAYNISHSQSSKSSLLIKNLKKFEKIIIDYENNNPSVKMKLIDFYNYILLRNADQQSINDYEDGVFLMTLHSAKGLEFENVIFTGLEENICPYKWPGLKKISEDQLDEEKRLFYVGITRAKKNLVLTYARKREWFSKETMNKPSRFLKLIPSRLIHILK